MTPEVDPGDRSPQLAAGSPVRIRLLGGFEVSTADSLVIDGSWRHSKARAVLELLALRAGTTLLHREQVYEAVWPDAASEQAADNFRKSLQFIRAASARGGLRPEKMIIVTRSMTGLAAGVWVDAQAFKSEARKALEEDARFRIETAAALYRGELLPDARYESWTEPYRDELGSLYAELVLRLGELEIEAGLLPLAREHVEGALNLNPANERVHRAMMRLYVRDGRRSDALLQYHRCCSLLGQELGVEPSAETQQLFQQIRDGSYPYTPLSPSAVVQRPLVSMPASSRDAEAAPRMREITALGQPRRFFLAAALLVSFGTAALAGLATGAPAKRDAAGSDLMLHLETVGTITRVGGDCATFDEHFVGTQSGEVTGGMVARAVLRTTTRLDAASACEEGRFESEAVLTDFAGNTLEWHSVGMVSVLGLERSDLVRHPATAVFVTGGTGAYMDSVGYGSCRMQALYEEQADDLIASRAQTDCRLKIVPRDATDQPLMVVTSTNSTTIPLFGGSTPEARPARLIVAYRNLQEVRLEGLLLRLSVPEGVEIKAWPGNTPEPALLTDVSTWRLSPLDAFSVGFLEINIRLVTAAESSLPVIAELARSGPAPVQPVRSDAVMLQVLP